MTKGLQSKSNVQLTTGKTAISGSGDDDEFTVTQAIVIGCKDPHRFFPITLEKPKALLPLCNVPLIEYTLEMLAQAGIKETFLVCNSFVDQYRTYLKNSRWMLQPCGMVVRLIVAAETSSVGDALRDIDDKGIIQNDFILVFGDLVGNADLSPVIEQHRQRRKADKNATLTMVLNRIQPNHYARSRTECAVYAISTRTNQLINYLPIESEWNTFSIPLPTEAFKKHTDISMHYDLIDCSLDICSPEVLSLFTENFDYQDLRKDFIRGILTSEIIPNKFYCQIIENCYCNRVSSPYMYNTITQDLINRWVFPITPENNPFSKASSSLNYTFNGFKNIYIGQDTIIDRTSEILSNSMIGHGSEISGKSKISNSIIGCNVFIGANCQIENCFIWDNCRIEDYCVVSKSIIGERAVLKSHTTMKNGCFIGQNCCIGPEVTIPAFSRVSSFVGALDESLESMTISTSSASKEYPIDPISEKIWKSQDILGSDANCYIWDSSLSYSFDGDAEYLDNSSNEKERADAIALFSTYKNNFQSIFDEKYKKYLIELEYSDQESEPEVSSEPESQTHDDKIIDNSLSPSSSGKANSVAVFHATVIDMVKNAIQSNYTIDNTALEINALKFACNSTFKECRDAIIPALCSFLDPSNIAQSTTRIFDLWSSLLQKFIHSNDDQIDTIIALQNCLANSSCSKAFLYILPSLFKKDILDDECILKWYHSHDSSVYQSSIKPFIVWLEGSDEEDEEE